MSISTVQRAIPPANNGLFDAPKIHKHPTAFFFKNLFFKIATLGLGKSLYEAKAAKREEEIAHVATDTLLALPHNFSEINPHSFKKTLHTNMPKGYQIVLEGNEIVLYKKEKHASDEFVPDKESRACLISFQSKSEFDQFVTHLKEIQAHPIFKNNIIHKLRELKIYDMPLLSSLNDIAEKFICQSDKNLVQDAIERKKIGPIKFSAYEPFLMAIDKGEIEAEDISMTAFLLTHHPNIKRTLCALSMDDPSVFSLIDKQLFEESRDPNNCPIWKTLDHERSRIILLHGLLTLGG